MSHSKEHLEHMMKELMEEAEKWDLLPKPASLWSSSTRADEVKEDMTMKTQKKKDRKNFNMLGCIFNPPGKSQELGGETRKSTEAKTYRGG